MSKNIRLFALLFPLVFSSLTGCSGKTSPVFVPYGSLFDASLTGDAPFHTIDYSYLSGMMEKDEDSLSPSFILVIRGVSSECVCWASLRSNLTKWMKERNAEVYLIESGEFSGKDYLGFSLQEGSSSLAIVNKGSIAYKETIQEDSSLSTSYDSFQSYMEEHVDIGSMLYVSLNQLHDLYFGDDKANFVIGFVQHSCPDCSYIIKNGIPDYLEKNQSLHDSYLFDCDVEGARLLNGVAPSQSAEAKVQWNAFKVEYGLSFSEDNLYGYGAGYVPTFLSILPSLIGEHAYEGVIDGAVFANDSLSKNTDGTYKISKTYWDNTHMNPFLEDANNLKAHQVSLTDLTALKTIPVSDVTEYDGVGYWKHEAAAVYEAPLLYSFFSEYLDPTYLAK